MQIPLGFNAGRNVQNQPVVWDYRKMVNPHICILGMTGAGKSYNLRKVVESLARTNDNPDYHAHVFDVHGDLHFEQSSEVLFSEQTQYGLNPLEISANPHFGGGTQKNPCFSPNSWENLSHARRKARRRSPPLDLRHLQ